MIGKNWKYKNQSIEKSTDEYEVMLADNLSPRGLESRDQSEIIPRYHGIITSATFASERVIPIEGFITADTRVGFGKAMTYLDRLFALQGNPWELELVNFEFTDDENNSWAAWAKIKKPIEYTLYDDDSFHFIRKFRVVLMCPDPNFYSSAAITYANWNTGFNNAISIPEEGVAVPNEGIAFNEGSDSNILAAADNDLGGNQVFEPKLVINVLRDVEEYVKIINTDTGKFIRFEIEPVIGDVIIIDMLEETATLNWVSIKPQKSFWDFFTVAQGENIDVYDATQTYYWQVFDFEAYFNAILQ